MIQWRNLHQYNSLPGFKIRGSEYLKGNHRNEKLPIPYLLFTLRILHEIYPGVFVEIVEKPKATKTLKPEIHLKIQNSQNPIEVNNTKYVKYLNIWGLGLVQRLSMVLPAKMKAK